MFLKNPETTFSNVLDSMIVWNYVTLICIAYILRYWGRRGFQLQIRVGYYIEEVKIFNSLSHPLTPPHLPPQVTRPKVRHQPHAQFNLVISFTSYTHPNTHKERDNIRKQKEREREREKEKKKERDREVSVFTVDQSITRPRHQRRQRRQRHQRRLHRKYRLQKEVPHRLI